MVTLQNLIDQTNDLKYPLKKKGGFQKGGTPWNKGKHWSEKFKKKSSILHTIIGKEKGLCIICNKSFEFYLSSGRSGNFCSRACFYKNHSTTILCKFCKMPITKSISFNKKRKFCSRQCEVKNRSVIGRITKKCEKCGKDFCRPKSTNPRQRFCSVLCAGKIGKTLYMNCVICHKEIKTYECSRNTRKCCSRKCADILNGINVMGRKHSPEAIETMRLSAYKRWGKILPNASPNLPERRNRLLYSIRHMIDYTDWKNKCLLRDCFTCQSCGRSKNEFDYLQLHVHHEKALFRVLIENKISNLEEARNCKEIWDINNGVTLCRECHEETDTFMGNFFLSKDFIDIRTKRW